MHHGQFNLVCNHSSLVTSVLTTVNFNMFPPFFHFIKVYFQTLFKFSRLSSYITDFKKCFTYICIDILIHVFFNRWFKSILFHPELPFASLNNVLENKLYCDKIQFMNWIYVCDVMYVCVCVCVWMFKLRNYSLVKGPKDFLFYFLPEVLYC